MVLFAETLNPLKELRRLLTPLPVTGQAVKLADAPLRLRLGPCGEGGRWGAEMGEGGRPRWAEKKGKNKAPCPGPSCRGALE